MCKPSETNAFEQLVRKLEPRSRLLRVWALTGGVSAQVTALELEQPGGHRKKLVVRRHGEANLRQNPQVAADEFRLLQTLHSRGLPVPAPYCFDESGEIFPRPYVVLEFIEGGPAFAPAELGDLTLQMAMHLGKIHRVDGSSPDLSFLPRHDRKLAAMLRDRPDELDDSLDEGRIRDALEWVWPLALRNRPALLHGDYWPGNVLWSGGRIKAVVDWEDAALGDPLADLANSRLEVLWAYGPEAMHQFTKHYLSLTGVDLTDLAYWDLCAALRPAGRIAEWASDAATEKAMREGHRLFVEQAFGKLSVGH